MKSSLFLILVGYIFITHFAYAESAYTIDVLGEVTLITHQDDQYTKKTYQTGDHFSLPSADKLCVLKGNGAITIMGGHAPITLFAQQTSDALPENKDTASHCYALPVLKKQKRSYSAYVFNIFNKEQKGETSIEGTRSDKDVYREPINLTQYEVLIIENDQWFTSPATLPIVLEIINQTKNIGDSNNNKSAITPSLRFESFQKNHTRFVVPKLLIAQTCANKNQACLLKVSNKQQNSLIESLISGD